MLFVLPKEVLIAGPFTGEFGWELMEWQGYVRQLKKSYKRTIVISYENSRYLYEDCELFSHGLDLSQSKFGYGILKEEMNSKLIAKCAEAFDIKSFDLFSPRMLNRATKYLMGGQSHREFHEPSVLNEKYDVAFHFRDFQREDGDEKNYPKVLVAEVAEKCKSLGLKVCFIGHPRMSFCPPGFPDRRSEDLKEAISAIGASRIVVGGSSAPMHLACLCNKSIVVWASTPMIMERYFSKWNPLGVNVHVVSNETFRPENGLILKKIKEALHDVNTP